MRAKKRKPYTNDLSDEDWDRIRPLVKADRHFGLKSKTKFSRPGDAGCNFLCSARWMHDIFGNDGDYV